MLGIICLFLAIGWNGSVAVFRIKFGCGIFAVLLVEFDLTFEMIRDIVPLLRNLSLSAWPTVQFRLTIFLLVYWSLLINFGPSVHTHSYFGLCGCGDAHVVEGSSGCGHSGCCPSEHADVPADSEVSSLHDCSLCKFFKYLNYSAADSVQWSSDESVHLVAISYDRFLSSKTFSSRARGPPALS